jgi:uncharacterized protein YfaQ (DUF2300 family)
VAVLNIDLVTCECHACGAIFGMSPNFHRHCRDDGATFHCPNGHPAVYTKPRAKQLEEALAAKTAELDQAQALARDAEAALVKAEGALAKAKKRVGAGSCPCCKRHFKGLQRHMESKHPDYKTGQAK